MAQKMEYITSPGDLCFTPAEAQKLVDKINAGSTKAPQVVEISGVWVHYAHLKSGGREVEAKINDLLSGASLNSFLEQKPVSSSTWILYVTPRNISPWSSKATSIAQVCGLKDVHRIERGRAILSMFGFPSLLFFPPTR